MARTRTLLVEFRSLVVLLAVLAATAATLIVSCGGGGGGEGVSSDGGLCDQCGATDGPCQQTGFIVFDATKPQTCPTPGVSEGVPTCVERALICRRKTDSAQQRCFPANSIDPSTNVDLFFVCDGSRPAPGTLVPPTETPTSTALTPTPASTPLCNNGIREDGEQCDITDFGGKTCADFCTGAVGGSLSCTSFCTINIGLCFGTCVVP